MMNKESAAEVERISREIAHQEELLKDVYNGMVEGSHTYVICDPSYRGSSNKGVFSGIVSANCGEQNLPEDRQVRAL